nr:type II keratin, NvKII {C-terminal} [newts, blastema, Peptide Partial, 15 aa] [Salamandridae]
GVSTITKTTTSATRK